MSLSVHIDSKNKDILILDEGPTQRLDGTTLTIEAKCLINFAQPRKRFILSLHFNWSNSFFLVNTAKSCHFKPKDSEMKIIHYS